MLHMCELVSATLLIVMGFRGKWCLSVNQFIGRFIIQLLKHVVKYKHLPIILSWWFLCFSSQDLVNITRIWKKRKIIKSWVHLHSRTQRVSLLSRECLPFEKENRNLLDYAASEMARLNAGIDVEITSLSESCRREKVNRLQALFSKSEERSEKSFLADAPCVLNERKDNLYH